MGCFAKGCLTLLIVGFILLASTWYLYVKTVGNLTSPAPANVHLDPPSESEFQNAENSLERLTTAIDHNKETTVEFTAADLNALFARDPEFQDWRGRVRIEIADSTMTIVLSAPLDSIPWPRTTNRWFNGRARFRSTYESGRFRFDIHSAEADGHHVPGIFLSGSFISAFNESMNRSFRNELRNYEGGSEFWNHVKTMSLVGDKLVVTTQAE
jgi:hypothetical protein